MPPFDVQRTTKRKIRDVFRRFVTNDEGAALVEYGLLLLLIAFLCIVALQGIGNKVSKSYDAANTLLP